MGWLDVGKMAGEDGFGSDFGQTPPQNLGIFRVCRGVGHAAAIEE